MPQFPHLKIRFGGREDGATDIPWSVFGDQQGKRKIQQVLREGFGAGDAAHLSSCHSTHAWVLI